MLAVGGGKRAMFLVDRLQLAARAIRQAGGAILVDNQPITSPYIVLAIGAPQTMRDSFEASSGLQRLRLLETAYRAGVTVSTEDELSVPAGNTREVRFAERAGS